MQNEVDILVATYQGDSYLKEQLQSLVQQSYSYFRILIRDDGSTDQTLSIIHAFQQTYPDKIIVIPSQQRLGVKGNFSELMRQAKAPYVMLCDQDDRWLPHKIEVSLHKMKELEKQYGNQVPLLIHTDLTVVNQNLEQISPSFWDYSRLKPQAAHSLNRLLAHNVITGCTILINQSLINLALPIPEEAIMHDWWLGLIATSFGKIDEVIEPTILYRQHAKNDIGAKNWKKITTYLEYAKKATERTGRKELQYRLVQSIRQAFYFLNRYGARLDPQKKCLVQNYVALGYTESLRKRYLFLRHRYFKNTLAKNIGMFLFL